MAAVLAAASRESLAAATQRLDAYVDTADARALNTLGDELFAFARLLPTERPLRRLLADPSTPEQARTGLAGQVLGGRSGERRRWTSSRGSVTSRWSQSLDLVDALEALARQATLAVAEKDGTLDDVEDELFRFGRILDRRAASWTRCSPTREPPAEGTRRAAGQVLAARVTPVTAALLRQAVRAAPRPAPRRGGRGAGGAGGGAPRPVGRAGVTAPIALSRRAGAAAHRRR